MKISESQLRRLIAEVLVESSDFFKDAKRFAKATYREILAPFEGLDESLVVIAAIMAAVMTAPEFLAALEAAQIRVIFQVALQVYDIWFSANLLTDSLLRAVPLIKALKDGNKKRAFEMAFMIVCNSAEIALFRQMSAAGRPITSASLSQAIDKNKFQALGKLIKTAEGITAAIGKSGIFNSSISSQIMQTSKSMAAGYSLMRLDMQKEDFAEAFSETIFPDEIDWDAFEEETIRLDAQAERNNKDTKAMIDGAVRELLKNNQ